MEKPKPGTAEFIAERNDNRERTEALRSFTDEQLETYEWFLEQEGLRIYQVKRERGQVYEHPTPRSQY